MVSTYVKRSKYFGDHGMYLPSRFIDDLPDDCVDRTGYTKFDGGQLRYERIGGFEREKPQSLKEQSFGKKDMVYSRQFGEGIVLDFESAGNKSVVTVDFDDFGIKKLLVKYAQLTKL
jgi:hypothetical protein